MSNFEIDAREALELARATLQKSEQNLAEAKQFHDAVLQSNNYLTESIGMLLPQSLTPEMTNGEDALSDTQKNALRIQNAIAKREFMDVLYSIQMLAVANRDIIEIEIRFGSRNSVIDLDVCKKVEGEYSRDNQIFSLNMYFDHQSDEENRNNLLAAESQIIKIIAQLREEGEGDFKKLDDAANELINSTNQENDEVKA